MGHSVQRYDRSVFDLEYVGVKAPQFSFTRLSGADPTAVSRVIDSYPRPRYPHFLMGRVDSEPGEGNFKPVGKRKFLSSE